VEDPRAPRSRARLAALKRLAISVALVSSAMTEKTNRLVPVLIEDCKKEPQTPFWTKVKMEIKKVF
jgi:hypothetical protein